LGKIFWVGSLITTSFGIFKKIGGGIAAPAVNRHFPPLKKNNFVSNDSKLLNSARNKKKFAGGG
jgi:hypothetical protein